MNYLRRPFFELTISLIYKNTKKLEFDALTMVDGNLFSIYPYSEDKFTITDVEHTPIKKFKTIPDLNKFKDKITSSLIEKKKRKIEKKINNYYPLFNKNFKYESYFISVKSKIISEKIDRVKTLYGERREEKITHERRTRNDIIQHKTTRNITQ
jgi:hypothetical protein